MVLASSGRGKKWLRVRRPPAGPAPAWVSVCLTLLEKRNRKGEPSEPLGPLGTAGLCFWHQGIEHSVLHVAAGKFSEKNLPTLLLLLSWAV